MRPVRLVARRFLGLEDVVVEFNQGDLFVIVGPNGAGKSSILEALFFALYGRSIRVERGREELLHRGFPGDALRVELEFLMGGKLFRVIREFSVKKRGVAVFEKKEQGNWKTICSGEQAVNREIEKALGFDVGTFRSSVFLAQGETLRFVEATPAERFRILSSLFGLGILDVVREKVKEDFNRLEGEIKPQEARLQILAEKNLEEEKKRLEGEIHKLEGELATLKAEREGCEKRLRDLEHLLELSRALHEEQEKRANLLQEKEVAQVKAQEDQIIVEAQRVKMEFEQPWRESLRELQRVSEEIAKRKERLERLRQDEAEAYTLLENLVKERDAGEREARFLGEKEQAFQSMAGTVEEIERLRLEASHCQKELETIQEELAQVQEEEQTLNKESQKLQEQLATLKKNFGVLDGELKRLREREKDLGPLYEERLAHLKDLEYLKKQEEKATRELGKLQKDRNDVLEALKRVQKDLQEAERERDAFEEEYRKRSRAFMVGTLRKEWAEKGVCPVCGTIIPFRGEEEEEVIDFLSWETHYRDLQDRTVKLRAQKENLEERWQRFAPEEESVQREGEKIRLEIAERERQKNAVEERIQQILRDLGWQEKRFNMEMLRELIRKKESEVEDFRNRCIRHEKELAFREERQSNLKKRRIELDHKLQEAEKRYRKIEEEIARRRNSVRAFLETQQEKEAPGAAEDSFREAFRRVTQAAKELKEELGELAVKVQETKERLRNLGERKEEVEGELLHLTKEEEEWKRKESARGRAFWEELERLGWSEDYFTEFAARKRGNWQEQLSKIEGSLRQLEERIEGLQREREHLVTVLGVEDSPEYLAKLTDEERNRSGRLRDEVGAMENRLGGLRVTLEKVTQDLEEWQNLVREIAGKKKQREAFEKLLSALEARNFKNYLLAILFRKLEEEASHLLFFLSGERYVLRMESEGGNAQMMVVDRRYGREKRPLQECSGGEKTLIALSLALAIPRLWLKEQGHKGSLDCLFIDEGFSPLDREHLELVADAILRLGKDGKMVGIVTHDQAFAEYFPLRLEVKEGKAVWKKNAESLSIS